MDAVVDAFHCWNRIHSRSQAAFPFTFAVAVRQEVTYRKTFERFFAWQPCGSTSVARARLRKPSSCFPCRTPSTPPPPGWVIFCPYAGAHSSTKACGMGQRSSVDSSSQGYSWTFWHGQRSAHSCPCPESEARSATSITGASLTLSLAFTGASCRLLHTFMRGASLEVHTTEMDVETNWMSEGVFGKAEMAALPLEACCLIRDDAVDLVRMWRCRFPLTDKSLLAACILANS